MLVDVNGTIVSYNIGLTNALGCNTAIYLLGTVEQAKSILFYLIKYISKDDVAIRTALSAADIALKHSLDYPTIVGDTAVERSKTFVNMFLNQITGALEIGAQKRPSFTLGQKSNIQIIKRG